MRHLGVSVSGIKGVGGNNRWKRTIRLYNVFCVCACVSRRQSFNHLILVALLRINRLVLLVGRVVRALSPNRSGSIPK